MVLKIPWGDDTSFKENVVDQCVNLKVSGSKFIILVLYVDDILLASNDVGLLNKMKTNVMWDL